MKSRIFPVMHFISIAIGLSGCALCLYICSGIDNRKEPGVAFFFMFITVLAMCAFLYSMFKAVRNIMVNYEIIRLIKSGKQQTIKDRIRDFSDIALVFGYEFSLKNKAQSQNQTMLLKEIAKMGLCEDINEEKPSSLFPHPVAFDRSGKYYLSRKFILYEPENDTFNTLTIKLSDITKLVVGKGRAPNTGKLAPVLKLHYFDEKMLLGKNKIREIDIYTKGKGINKWVDALRINGMSIHGTKDVIDDYLSTKP